MDGHSWSIDDINTQNEIWDFFTKYLSIPANSDIELSSKNKKILIKRLNLLGQEVNGSYNGIVLYLYDDGTVEKKIINE